MAGKSRNIEKCFEDSQESGVLNVNGRNLKEFPLSVDLYDLTDVVRADVSRNKFAEIPGELTNSFMMECLNCSYNSLRSVLDLSKLTSLTHLDLSHNQIQTLPSHVCALPLKMLILSHNKLEYIPNEIGWLGKLQHLDVSSNMLSNIPSTFGELVSLRFLNLRRNKLLTLPDEISKLKYLMMLDISCNCITAIPPALRLTTSLVKLDSRDNPLTSPPAQICIKGRLHIFKYLSIAAQQQDKALSYDKELRKNCGRSPSVSSISSSSLIEHDLRLNQTNQSPDVTEAYSHDAPHPAEKRSQEPVIEDFGFLEKEKTHPVIEEEKSPQHLTSKIEKRSNASHSLPFANNPQERLKQQNILKQKNMPISKNLEGNSAKVGHSTMSLDRASVRKLGGKIKSFGESESLPGKPEVDVSGRKEQLLKLRKEALTTKQKLEKITAEPEKVPTTDPGVFEGIGKRSSLSKGRTNKALKEGHSTFTMRRIFDSAKEEFQQLEKLRQAIESRLGTKLPDDLPAALADGVVLCHLVNHVKKSTIPVIHVPSGGMPKLTMPKCLMNVDAFLEGCRKLGVEKAQLCSPGDILEEKNPNKVCTTVHALLQATAFTNL